MAGVGERPLGIPTIRDRVIQTAAKLVLEPIFEADFEDNAYGYRPARGAVDVYERVRDFLARRHKVAGRGTHRFSCDVVYGERGLLRLERLPLMAPRCASR